MSTVVHGINWPDDRVKPDVTREEWEAAWNATKRCLDVYNRFMMKQLANGRPATDEERFEEAMLRQCISDANGTLRMILAPGHRLSIVWEEEQKP